MKMLLVLIVMISAGCQRAVGPDNQDSDRTKKQKEQFVGPAIDSIMSCLGPHDPNRTILDDSDFFEIDYDVRVREYCDDKEYEFGSANLFIKADRDSNLLRIKPINPNDRLFLNMSDEGKEVMRKSWGCVQDIYARQGLRVEFEDFFKDTQGLPMEIALEESEHYFDSDLFMRLALKQPNICTQIAHIVGRKLGLPLSAKISKNCKYKTKGKSLMDDPFMDSYKANLREWQIKALTKPYCHGNLSNLRETSKDRSFTSELTIFYPPRI